MTQKSASDEQRLDAWERFERAVDAGIKSGPKHRDPKDVKKPRRPSQKRASVERDQP
jgi:hypothetical protein